MKTNNLTRFIAAVVVLMTAAALFPAKVFAAPELNAGLVSWNQFIDGPYADTVHEKSGKVIQKPSNAAVEVPSPVPVPSTSEVNATKPTLPAYVPDCGTQEENEEKIFAELTTTWGLNEAAAYGVMTNILVESAFSTTAIGPGGDFGIVQWCGSRRDDFVYWCNAKEYNPYNIDTQILYLGLELTNAYYNSVYVRLAACENNTDGLSDAAYIFCRYFEIPQNTEAQSLYRADLAVQMYGGNF